MNPDLDAGLADQDSAGDAPAGNLHVIALPAALEIQLAAEFSGDQIDSPPGFFYAECMLTPYPHRVLFQGP